MDSAFTVDLTDFNRAVGQYAANVPKTFAEATNRCVLNLCIHAISETKQAEKSVIQSLQSKDWWPKFIAKKVGQEQGINLEQHKRAAGQAYKAQKGLGGGYGSHQRYFDLAVKMSKRIIGRRTAAITFTRGFFAGIAKAIKVFGVSSGGRTAGEGSIRNKDFTGMKFAFKQASPPSYEAKGTAEYNFATPKPWNARVETILQESLRKAIPKTTKDILDYTNKEVERNIKMIEKRI